MTIDWEGWAQDLNNSSTTTSLLTLRSRVFLGVDIVEQSAAKPSLIFGRMEVVSFGQACQLVIFRLRQTFNVGLNKVFASNNIGS